MNAINIFTSSLQPSRNVLAPGGNKQVNALESSALSFDNILTEVKEAPKDSKESADFESLIQEETTSESFEAFLSNLDDKEVQGLIEKLMNLETNSDSINLLQEELAAISLKIKEMTNEEWKNEKLKDLLLQDLSYTSIKEIQRQYEKLYPEETVRNRSYVIETTRYPIENYQESIQSVKQDLQQVYQKVEQLLSSIQSDKQIANVAPKVLELLQQWRNVKNNVPAESISIQKLEAENKEIMRIWQNLLQTYQKRADMISDRRYMVDAKMTSKDVARWLGNAMEGMQLEPTKQQLQSVQGANLATPISKVEQLYIHLNHAQNQIPADKQLLQQFKNIMTANQITQLQQTNGGFRITLNPQNLGEMMIRFMQINGELSVKILVTSVQAKEMLEKNMHQLRSMFAPHQVVVEKQESVNLQSAESQKKEHNRDEDNESKQNDHQQQKQEEEVGNSFSNVFEELLMNEKV